MLDFKLLEFLFSATIVVSLLKIIYDKLNTDIKKVSKEIELLEQKINKLEIYALKNFIEKEDFKESINNLSIKLDKIFEKTKN
jgi:hypothetical protein